MTNLTENTNINYINRVMKRKFYVKPAIETVVSITECGLLAGSWTPDGGGTNFGVISGNPSGDGNDDGKYGNNGEFAKKHYSLWDDWDE